MAKFPLLLLLGACGTAAAQTPAGNIMPDGSRDMYAGIGVLSAPAYEGASHRRNQTQAVLQAQWSNGLFVSGLSAGMHLSQRPDLEYGPLLAIEAGRKDGNNLPLLGHIPGTLTDTTTTTTSTSTTRFPSNQSYTMHTAHELDGMERIGARLQAGGFFNLYLSDNWRLTNQLLVGAGKQHTGVRWSTDVRQSLAGLPSHHRVSWQAGVSLANHAYMDSYFGVSDDEALNSGYPATRARAGLRDIHAGLHWNWVLSPTWLLASAIEAERLCGDAGRSPLVLRRNSASISSALAYRF